MGKEERPHPLLLLQKEGEQIAPNHGYMVPVLSRKEEGG